MTFSILARNPETGEIGGAAATGSLCVGGWVLRGDLKAGMSASQGAAPSTFWGENVLTRMRDGADAEEAVAAVTDPDSGRAWRQLSAIGLKSGAAAFTGLSNTPEMGSKRFESGIVAGNMLTGLDVLDAMVEAFTSGRSGFEERLLASLDAAAEAGGDSRGLMSAALLVLSPEAAPLTLRIDYHENPLLALRALHSRARSGDYAEWTRQVPTLVDPERVLD